MGTGHFLPYSGRDWQAEKYVYRRYFPVQILVRIKLEHPNCYFEVT